jgi:Family of unknown function (DUF5670)
MSAGAKDAGRQPEKPKENFMLYTLAIILIILWVLGLITGTAGGLIHILLVLAIVAVLLRVISGRKPVL